MFKMLTGEQIRAARAMLNWSQSVLASKSGVSVASIRRIEPQNGVPSANAKFLAAFERCFSEAGISFSDEPNNVGVSLDVRQYGSPQ